MPARGVSIRARPRRATVGDELDCRGRVVSIRARPRRATLRLLREGPGHRVSIRARPRRATLISQLRSHGALPFQSARARGARHPCRHEQSRVLCGFNPRAPAARDLPKGQFETLVWVSIRARPRRATLSAGAPEPIYFGVSIRARPRRATTCLTSVGAEIEVSIRARARRATSKYDDELKDEMFQSARARGARLISHLVLHADPLVSIRARPRRATRLFPLIGNAVIVSIRARPRRATRRRWFGLPLRDGFNPRAPAARDGYLTEYLRDLEGFNPRAPAARDW